MSVEPRDGGRRDRLLPVCDASRRMRTAAVAPTGNTSTTRDVVFNERLTMYVYDWL